MTLAGVSGAPVWVGDDRGHRCQLWSGFSGKFCGHVPGSGRPTLFAVRIGHSVFCGCPLFWIKNRILTGTFQGLVTCGLAGSLQVTLRSCARLFYCPQHLLRAMLLLTSGPLHVNSVFVSIPTAVGGEIGLTAGASAAPLCSVPLVGAGQEVGLPIGRFFRRTF